MSQKRRSDHNHDYSAKKPRFADGPADHHISESNQPQIQAQVPPLPVLDPKWESMVFTHPSFVGQELQNGTMRSYDRLEFLGDAYLEVIATRLIWESYKDLGTGKMSNIREGLIKNETLSEFTIMYGLDKRLRIAVGGHSQHRMGRTKINGDVFEAYVAAVVLSDPVKGFETAEDWLTQLWEPKLKSINATPTDLRSKEELARRILYKGVSISYVDERPPVMHRSKGLETYFIGVYFTGWGYEKQHLGSGTGLSKKAAGMEAATNALQNKSLLDQIAAKKLEALAKKREEEFASSRVGGELAASGNAPT